MSDSCLPPIQHDSVLSRVSGSALGDVDDSFIPDMANLFITPNEQLVDSNTPHVSNQFYSDKSSGFPSDFCSIRSNVCPNVVTNNPPLPVETVHPVQSPQMAVPVIPPIANTDCVFGSNNVELSHDDGLLSTTTTAGDSGSNVTGRSTSHLGLHSNNNHVPQVHQFLLTPQILSLICIQPNSLSLVHWMTNTATLRVGEFDDNVFGLPRGFLSSHSTIVQAEKCDPHLLPGIPTCPGPYLSLFGPRLLRPPVTKYMLDHFPDEANIYIQVVAFACPNYLGAKIQLNKDFPVLIWEAKLSKFHDTQVTNFMRYGWPTSFLGNSLPVLNLDNHASAMKQPQHVSKFIAKEISLNGLMGPFHQSPFHWLRKNPLMARPKKDSPDYRIILDLSFPEMASVNSFIPRVLYEGGPYKLHLPTALEMSELIAAKGQGSYMYKVDLARAYRQLPADPYDWPLLGIEWQSEIFVDKAIPFGIRHVPWLAKE